MYALSIGMANVDDLVLVGMRHLTLERGLAAGGAILLAGLGVLSWIVASWVGRDFSFDPTNMLRPALLGLTLVVIGAQAIFTSFFAGLLAIGMEGRNDKLSSVPNLRADVETSGANGR